MIFFSLTYRLSRRVVVGLCTLVAGQALTAEIDLKALAPLETKKKRSGAYVGVFAGVSLSQSADMKLDYIGHSLDYDVLDRNGDLLVGLEVGYSWRTRFPVEVGLEFEAFYGSTEINSAARSNAGTPIELGDVATTQADLSYVAFMLNGTLTLDLRKYRPWLGKYVTRLRPYVGAGIGGAQLFYRNQRIQSFGDLAGVPTAAANSPFSIDEFVFASQIFGGLEIMVNDKLGIYSEYRRLSFAKTNDLQSLDLNIFLGGLRLRY